MNNLKALRKEMGYTFKREMAFFLKIDEANYGKMENGKAPITKPMIEILEDKFANYNLNWILYNELPKHNTESNDASKEELNQSNNIHSQKQKPNSNMQDYKDVAMKSMAQRIEELESKTINLTVRLSKYESIEEVKPNSREAS